MVDYEAKDAVREALEELKANGIEAPLIIDVTGGQDRGSGIGELTYEVIYSLRKSLFRDDDSLHMILLCICIWLQELLAEGSADYNWTLPEDEFDAISLNYTSGKYK